MPTRGSGLGYRWMGSQNVPFRLSHDLLIEMGEARLWLNETTLSVCHMPSELLGVFFGSSLIERVFVTDPGSLKLRIQGQLRRPYL